MSRIGLVTAGECRNLSPGAPGQAPQSRAREEGLRNLYEVKTLVNHVRGAGAEKIMAFRIAR
jgi:hypothetical protein